MNHRRHLRRHRLGGEKVNAFLPSEEQAEQQMIEASSGWISEQEDDAGSDDPPAAVITPSSSKSHGDMANQRMGGGALSLSAHETETIVLRQEEEEQKEEEDPQWKEAIDMIRANPSLLTPRVFWTTLEQDPPSHVVRAMLLLSPQVASIPKQGPTALQVAVQEGACLGAIRAVLEACPFALCVTNPHHAMDPLSYAKRHRKEERELIELLSRPLSYWVSKEQENQGSRMLESSNDGGSALGEYGVGLETKRSTMIPSFFPVSSPAPPAPPAPNKRTTKHQHPAAAKNHRHSNPQAVQSATADRQELNNVKLLCAQVLKGHKKLSKQLKVCQEQLSLVSNKKQEDEAAVDDARLTTSTTTATMKEEVLQGLQDQQQFHFRRQLIALDMKERAFFGRVKKMEERCKQHCTDQLSSHWNQSMEVWNQQNAAAAAAAAADNTSSISREEWKEWKVLLDHEVQVNAHFRNDFSRWMEEQQQCESTNSRLAGFGSGKDNEDLDGDGDDDDDNGKATPILFATNLGEVNESTPLCQSGSSSSDDNVNDNDKDDTTPSRRCYYKNHHVNDDDDDDDDDELRKVPRPAPPRRPFLIRRRHPWTPLARKWDRVSL